MIILSTLINIPLYHSNKDTIGFVGLILMAIQCFLMVVSIYLTGKALKKHFNDDETVGNSYLSDSQQFNNEIIDAL